ncbi:hypothetical protein TEU_08360 [Thermococcus eurythermalis]|uniref:Uncharacterized protein n=1 Tax=Thermococcus eurythermalis TaxID=1505907 RepID=A0A097QV40_9EURY|nr:hypothetical protein [Thermococcus eurythermalis]AIU70341.1 hypothetical protein TEU_08360 [Thermococcus eurythermalis]
MGTTYYTVAVFDKSWKEVLDKLSREFKYTRELAYQRERREEHLKFIFDMRGFRLVAVGELHYELKTTEGDSFDWLEVETYSKENMTLLQIGVSTGRWLFVLSPELMKFLGKLMRVGAVLICGYTDDHDLRDAGFEENNQFLFYEWLVETVKRKKLEIVPSDVTIVKKELLDLEDGLYELIERPGREEEEYVLIKRLDSYKILVSVRESDLTDEESYRELIEDKAWFGGDITTLIFKRIGKKIKNEFLIKRAEEYFKAQTGAELY